jgi:phosphoribosylanthranilate isomerase
VNVAVKICGITTPEDGRLAAASGAAAVGLVFWPRSPRYVEPARAREIADALPPFVARVGVFVDETPQELERIADVVRLDVLQLHGSESPALLRDLSRRALKAIRVDADFDVSHLDTWFEAGVGVLLDRGSARRPGGTGRPFDWSRVEGARTRGFLAVAGGLSPENVSEAIERMRPDAVDVSTGVESAPGRKDPERLRAFMEAVRRTGGDHVVDH